MKIAPLALFQAAILPALLAFSPRLQAADRFVDPYLGSDATGDGSKANPFKTLGFAIEQASAGDTVHAKAGIYMNENFPLVMRHGVLVRGESALTTILDGGTPGGAGATVGVLFRHNLDAAGCVPSSGGLDGPFLKDDGVYLQNFAIRNFGRGIQLDGDPMAGGVAVRPVIANCVLYDNFLGVYSRSASPILLHETMTANVYAIYKPAVDSCGFWGCAPMTIVNSVISGNGHDLFNVVSNEIRSSQFESVSNAAMPCLGSLPCASVPAAAACGLNTNYQHWELEQYFMTAVMGLANHDFRLVRMNASLNDPNLVHDNPLTDRGEDLAATMQIALESDASGLGNPRVTDGNWDGAGALPDIGAFELQTQSLMPIHEGFDPSVGAVRAGLQASFISLWMDGPTDRKFHYFVLNAQEPSSPVWIGGLPLGNLLFVSSPFSVLAIPFPLGTDGGPTALGAFSVADGSGNPLISRLSLQLVFANGGVPGLSNLQSFPIVK